MSMFLAAAFFIYSAYPASVAAQSSITLRRAATITPGTTITLADIADLHGPDAEPLGSLVVDDAGRRGRVDLDEVRAALQTHGVAWARLVLRGSLCEINAPAPAPREPRESPSAASAAPAPVSPVPGTVGALFAPALARQLAVDPGDLRLQFDPDDAPLLTQSVGARTVEVHPLGRAERTQCRVTIYDGDRIAVSELVRVSVQVRRLAPVAKTPIKRGTPIAAGDFAAEDCWLAPGAAAADPARIIGSMAKAHLAAGQPILAPQVQSPAAVERGQIVTVHCVSGSVLVRLSARALADAAEGESVEVEHLDSTRKDPRRFRGRVSGPGRVVVAVSTDQSSETESTDSQERLTADEP